MPKVAQPDPTRTLRERRVRDSSHGVLDGVGRTSRFTYLDIGSASESGATAAHWVSPISVPFAVIIPPKGGVGYASFHTFCKPSWPKSRVGVFLQFAHDSIPVAPADQVVLHILGGVVDDIAFEDIPDESKGLTPTRVAGTWRPMWNLFMTIPMAAEGMTATETPYTTEIAVATDFITHYSTGLFWAIYREIDEGGDQDTYLGNIGLTGLGVYTYPVYE